MSTAAGASAATDGPAPAGGDGDGAAGNGPRWRSRLALVAGLAPVAALGVGAAVWWFAATGAAVRDVGVVWADGSPRCTGATVRAVGGRPMIEAVEGMRCTVTVQVHNYSGREVRLGRAVLTAVGPRTKGVVAAATVAGRRPGGAGSAVVDLHRTLASGARTSFDVVLVLHPEGCMADGSFSTRPWPRIEVSSWHRSAWRGTSEAFSYHHAGRTPGCRG